MAGDSPLGFARLARRVLALGHFAALFPVVEEEGAHAFGEAGVVEDDGGPGGFGEDGVEEGDEAEAAVEDGELHGQVFGFAHFDAGGLVFREALFVVVVDGAVFDQEAAGDAAFEGLADQFFLEGIDGIGGAGELEVFVLGLLEHAAVLLGDLGGIGDDAEVIERAAGAVGRGVGAHEVVDEGMGVAGLLFHFVAEGILAAAQIAGQGHGRFDGAEEFGAFLDDLGKALFYQGIKHFVDFLAGHLGARGKLKGLEPRVAEEHQIGAGLVGVEADLLQAPPKSLIFRPAEFLRHPISIELTTLL